MHSVERGIHQFAVDRWDAGGFEALHELVNRGGRHDGGEELINK